MQSHNSSSNTLFLWWLDLFILSVLTHSVIPQGNQKRTGFTHLTSWENAVYEPEWTLTHGELETIQVI